MARRFPLVAALARAISVLVLAGAAGCDGVDCEELCDDVDVCPQGVGVDACTTQCQDMERAAESAGCATDFVDFLGCAGDADDACNPDDCAGEAIGLFDCTAVYCAEHPDDAGCRGFGGSCFLRSSGGTAPDCIVEQSCGPSTFALSCTQGGCTCSQDGVEQANVAYDPGFCQEQLPGRVALARAACGWPG